MNWKTLGPSCEPRIPGCQVELVATEREPVGPELAAHRSPTWPRSCPDAARRWDLDFCSNVTAVDWPERVQTNKTKTKQVVDGVEKEIEQTVKTTIPGYLEVVYHLFSMARKEGPVVIRMRTAEPDGRCSVAIADAGLEERRIPGAGGFRSVRHRLRWASGFAAHPDVGGVYGLSDSQGLCSSAGR